MTFADLTPPTTPAPAPAPAGAIRVLVAASSAVVRAGLEAVVATGSGLEVVGRASNVAALERNARILQPDVVLYELESHDDDPMASLGPLVAGARSSGPSGSPRPAPVLVVLADDTGGGWVAEALRAGVRGALPREATAAEIVAAVASAAAGLVALSPDLVEAILPALSSAPRALPPAPIQALTPREIEVLGMLAEGLGNKIIARRLGISEHTIKFHVGSIFSKLNASSRTEAVTLGARQGLIML